MSFPKKQAQIQRVTKLYAELNYPKESRFYPELKKQLLSFFETYQDQNGKYAREFTSMTKYERATTKEAFSRMAKIFSDTDNRGNHFWPSDPSSPYRNGLDFSVPVDSSRILSYLGQLFYRRSRHLREYDSTKSKKTTDSPDSLDEDEPSPSFTGSTLQPDGPQNKDTNLPPDSPAARFETSESRPFQPHLDEPEQSTTAPLNVADTVNTPAASRRSGNATDFRGEYVDPPSIIDLINTPSTFTSTRHGNGGAQKQSGKRTRGTESLTPSKKKTPAGKAGAGSHTSPEGTRWSSRNRTKRVKEGFVYGSDVDAEVAAAVRRDQEEHEARNAQRSEQHAANKYTVIPTIEGPSASGQNAPEAPMHSSPEHTEPAQQGIPKVPPKVAKVVDITTKVILSAGRLTREVPWQSESIVARMNLTQFVDEITKLLDLKEGGFTIKGFKLTLRILDAERKRHESEVPLGREDLFDSWKRTGTALTATAVKRRKQTEQIVALLPVSIEIIVHAEGQEVESATEDELDLDVWN
ncbi:hypothetical protein D7B24_008162 [Verticillium nonalfalfae]|uniref:Uncharacterized protein n=1 Tax=Verticillium nonalfalfae TaxID=1051616 RepID=A0A3M9YN52_9PEZI|nr:uncharacterized protein D7B24_008162 [Verticillium nonalfalfae]RNJ60470.1 hypothetical protein D7B24_008162 [Verticillium nonalfalfae]